MITPRRPRYLSLAQIGDPNQGKPALLQIERANSYIIKPLSRIARIKAVEEAAAEIYQNG